MKRDIITLWLCLLCTTIAAQEKLQSLTLFDKLGKAKDVTRIEMNGPMLVEYDMSTYRSLLFKHVIPYLEQVERALAADKGQQMLKVQEVTEDGHLISAYYQLADITRKGRKLHRYLLFKRGKKSNATLVYIEGTLSHRQLLRILYRQ